MEPPRAVIRRLGPLDVDAFRALRLRGLREHPGAFGEAPDEFEALSRDGVAGRLAHRPGNARVFGAALEGGWVGVAGLHQRPDRRKGRHLATLWGMYVVPEVRGRGVGRALVERVLDEARAMDDVLEVRLAVAVGNAPARALYERMGFEVWGREPHAMRLGEAFIDEWLMRRVL